MTQMAHAQHGQARPHPAMVGTDPAITLIETTERLADVLQRETTLLRGMKLADAAAVQLEKATLAEIYERCIREMQSGTRSIAETIPGQQRTALQQAGERLASASIDNERALRAAHTVNERVLAAIVDAAREQRTATHAYGAKGANGTSTSTLSLAVDRQL